MLTTTYPPLPDTDDIRNLCRDKETINLLVRLRADVAAAVRKLELETILALARQHYPEAETDYQAAAMLGLEITDFLRALAQHGEDVRSLDKAETVRLAPLVAAAGRRTLEIPRLLEGVRNALRFMDGAVEERRETLRQAGVKPHEVERLIAQDAADRDVRRSTLNDERMALLAEQEDLERFMKTGNEDRLPAGFKIAQEHRFVSAELHRALVSSHAPR